MKKTPELDAIMIKPRKITEMKKLIILFLNLLLATYSWEQGCLAIRNVAGISPDLLFENMKPNEKFILNVTNRYFEASSTYIGDKYITDSLVTNRIYTLNISVLRLLENGWSLAVNVPISSNSRTNNRDH